MLGQQQRLAATPGPHETLGRVTSSELASEDTTRRRAHGTSQTQRKGLPEETHFCVSPAGAKAAVRYRAPRPLQYA